MDRKTTKSFRLSKQAKRLCATIVDAHARGEFRRAMIQAELQGSEAPARKERGDRNEKN
jgi:hypothetical protein